MLSIENTYNFDEVREWDARVRKGLNPGEEVGYAVELKVDGVAVSLRYEAGRFVLGATRGTATRATTSPPTSGRSEGCRWPSATTRPRYWRSGARSI